MLFDFEGYRSDIRNQSSLLCRAEFLKVCHRDITNRSVSSLIRRSRRGLLQMQSSGVSLSFICHPPGAFGEEHLYRASAERNSQKTADEMRRDWFQQNIYWQPWEEEIITTLTSFDHGYSYSQNVSVDRTMRWRAGSSCEFALLFFFPSLLLHAYLLNRSSVSRKERQEGQNEARGRGTAEPSITPLFDL